jgi:hypothetical protein
MNRAARTNRGGDRLVRRTGTRRSADTARESISGNCYAAAATSAAVVRSAHQVMTAFVCALLLGIICGIGPSAAAGVQTRTSEGVPLDEPILIRLKGMLLRIPAGYLWPWPTQRMRNRVNDTKDLDFDFWMPDRRYPTRQSSSYVGVRPKERGRGEPPPDAYVVWVRQLQPIGLDEPGYISPEKGFRNLTSLAGIASYSFKEEEFGLVQFWRHHQPNPLLDSALQYRHPEGSDPQVLLHCTPPHETPPFPGCNGTIHLVAGDLAFFIHFPRSDLPHWREIVLAVSDLFKSWQAGP